MSIGFVPCPVIGGILAGTGPLLVKGAMEVMIAAVRRVRHFLVMPSMILLATGLFYPVCCLSKTTIEAAGAGGAARSFSGEDSLASYLADPGGESSLGEHLGSVGSV
jgi:hypothetical protein